VVKWTDNLSTYKKPQTVQVHYRQADLQNPEAAILEILRDELDGMKMLDISVGAGRTTVHFANLVGQYVGIDYSENMIRACRQRFPHPNKPCSFEVCGVRDMHMFHNIFDFVLFSFNGLDYISHQDRLTALVEIRRVSKPGAFFCFSTHNLQGIDRLFNMEWTANPIALCKKIATQFFLRIFNKNIGKFKTGPYATVVDGALGFRLLTYYIRPQEQILQLQDLGFHDIRLFGLDGREITQPTELNCLTDSWIYYLCNS